MAGGKQSNVRFGAVVLAIAACLAALIQTSAAATSHTVGGSTGWGIPTSNSMYSTWAAQQTFRVGDTLVFNFQTGQHTVAEVSKSAYDACTTSNPISTASTGPASLTISTSGTHYYICTISGHCTAGQKLAITATGSSSAAPSTSPAPSTSAAPSTSPASSPPAPSTSTAPSTSPASSPPAPSTSTAPSSSPTSSPAPTTATPPVTPTVPSAQSPSGGAAAPPPSSATVAGAGLMVPIMMVAAAFLV